MACTVIMTKEIRKEFDVAIKNIRQDEIAFTWIRSHQTFCSLDIKTMTGQMKEWKKLRKQGKLSMEIENNSNQKHNELELFNFVIQTPSLDMGWCPYSMSVLGIMVDGYTYSFTNQKNRDAIFKYVMGV